MDQSSRNRSERRSELAFATTLAGLRVEVALIKLKLALRAGFNPDQPRDGVGRWSSTGGGGLRRVERDDPTGGESWKRIGEWRRPDGGLDAALVTNRDGSTVVSRFGPGDRERHTVTLADGHTFIVDTDVATQTVSTGDGRVVSRTTETPDGPVAEPVVQPVLFSPDPISTTIVLGTLFLALSAQNGRDGTAVLDFNAVEFKPGATFEDPAIRVGRRTRDEVDRACPRHGEVQARLDDATARIDRQMNFFSAAERGTLIHRDLEKQVNGLRDPGFVVEYSVIKSVEASYSQRHSVRIDVLENVGEGTVCVYDIKTGDRRLSGPRMAEIAGEVHSHFIGTTRILVIEVRPRK